MDDDGSVLDLPYSYKPTPGGTIAMQRSMDTLSNLAFLYILAGGMLPHHGFGNVTGYLEDNLGEGLDGYHGVGVEEVQDADMADDAALQQESGYNGFEDAGDDGAAVVDDNAAMEGFEGGDNEFDGTGGGVDDYGDFGDDNNVVRGTDVAPTDYGDDAGGGYGSFFPGASGNETGEDTTNGLFESNPFGGGMGGFDTGDGGGDTGGDCDCGEGLGEIMGAIMDMADSGE